MAFKQIKCKECKTLFTPKSENNVFCCRKCFKISYYEREKKKNKDVFPNFTCPYCRQNIQLSFSPMKDPMKWSNYVCNGCNTLMIDVIDLVSTEDEPIT